MKGAPEVGKVESLVQRKDLADENIQGKIWLGPS